MAMPPEVLARRRCGAKTRDGTPCKTFALHGSTRCRMHGGANGIGAGAANFRHGRYSRVLPANLRATYDAAVADPDLLSIREDIALLDSRLSEMVRTSQTGLPPDLAKRVKGLLSDLSDAHAGIEGAPPWAESFTAISGLLARAVIEAAMWADIIAALESRRKLVESERKRLVEMEAIVTSEQAMTFVAAVMASLRTHVKDRDALGAIANDLRLLQNVPDRSRLADGAAAGG